MLGDIYGVGKVDVFFAVLLQRIACYNLKGLLDIDGLFGGRFEVRHASLSLSKKSVHLRVYIVATWVMCDSFVPGTTPLPVSETQPWHPNRSCYPEPRKGSYRDHVGQPTTSTSLAWCSKTKEGVCKSSA